MKYVIYSLYHDAYFFDIDKTGYFQSDWAEFEDAHLMTLDEAEKVLYDMGANFDNWFQIFSVEIAEDTVKVFKMMME